MVIDYVAQRSRLIIVRKVMGTVKTTSVLSETKSDDFRRKRSSQDFRTKSTFVSGRVRSQKSTEVNRTMNLTCYSAKGHFNEDRKMWEREEREIMWE